MEQWQAISIFQFFSPTRRVFELQYCDFWAAFKFPLYFVGKTAFSFYFLCIFFHGNSIIIRSYFQSSSHFSNSFVFQCFSTCTLICLSYPHTIDSYYIPIFLNEFICVCKSQEKTYPKLTHTFFLVYIAIILQVRRIVRNVGNNTSIIWRDISIWQYVS